MLIVVRVLQLKFYGVIQAFREGRLPSNQQISETLDYVLNHSPVDETKLSHEGKQLVQDVRDIIKTAGLMVEQKNADELFQVRRLSPTRVYVYLRPDYRTSSSIPKPSIRTRSRTTPQNASEKASHSTRTK